MRMLFLAAAAALAVSTPARADADTPLIAYFCKDMAESGKPCTVAFWDCIRPHAMCEQGKDCIAHYDDILDCLETATPHVGNPLSNLVEPSK